MDHKIVDRQRRIQFTHRIANRTFQRHGIIRRANDKIHVRPEELIHLSRLKIKLRPSGLIHSCVLRVFNHADDREPDFRIWKPGIHTPTDRTAGPEPLRERLVDHHCHHRVGIIVLRLKRAPLQPPGSSSS